MESSITELVMNIDNLMASIERLPHGLDERQISDVLMCLATARYVITKGCTPEGSYETALLTFKAARRLLGLEV